MNIAASFKGQNGSLGYKNGQRYSLRMREFRGLVVVERAGGAGRCIYTSLTAFLRNWDSVTAA